MVLNERQQKLLALVEEKGFASVESLSTHFNVTPQTIRRDINKLSGEDLLRRYHGGVGLPSSANNIDYNTRKVLHLEEKRQIAGMVAKYIPDEASLFINLGTTTEEVARSLNNHKRLRVITNNLNVASCLGRNPKHEVIITGGLVRDRDLGVTGESTINFIREFKVDYAIIGVSGIEEDGTLRDYDYREVRVSEAIIQQSREVLLVADHSKFGRNALVRLGNISDLDVLFTDQLPPESIQMLLEKHGVHLHVAEVEHFEEM